MAELEGSQLPIELGGGYRLQAPGLKGEIVTLNLSDPGTRAEQGYLEEGMQKALSNAGLITEQVFEIKVDEDLAPTPGGSTTRADGIEATTRAGEPAIILSAPVLEDDYDYAVLYTDENGVATWVMPEPGASRKAGETLDFHLPRNTTIDTEAAPEGTRGPLAKLGRRLVRLLAWPLKDLLGKPIVELARAWEATHRPYGFLTMTEQGFEQTVDWGVMQAGRALLMLHGTFSSAEASFTFKPETVAALHQHYGGRLLAFNHPSLHHSPQDNIQVFFSMLPQGMKLDLDIITHSRGGLVGRVLVERQAAVDTLGKQVAVRKALLVASPNQGTILADPTNNLDMLDRYTNLLTNLPDNVYTLAIEGVLAAVKLIGVAALTSLPGLACLIPGNPWLTELNTKPKFATQYFGISSDFQTDNAAWQTKFKTMVADKFVDKVFGVSNDMVVPTQGSYQSEQEKGGFKMAKSRIKTFGVGVHHCAYFTDATVNRQIVSFLTK